jgi:hypothetical protein
MTMLMMLADDDDSHDHDDVDGFDGDDSDKYPFASSFVLSFLFSGPVRV